MTTIVFIWEVALLFSLLVLLFMMQDWSKFSILKKYLENKRKKKQDKKDELAAEKLLDDLPKGVTRYKEQEISQK